MFLEALAFSDLKVILFFMSEAIAISRYIRPPKSICIDEDKAAPTSVSQRKRVGCGSIKSCCGTWPNSLI
eukprot:Gb_23648 [translate_table: standard]